MLHSINIATVMYGFRELGAEIVPYHFIDEIEGQIGPEDIVLDYIEQCQWVFKKFGHPTYMDCYPERLKPFLKRKWVSDPKAVPAAESWVSHDLQDDVIHTLS
ncbi:hypothetical protein BTH95_06160 [Lactobacillus delbrueckii subsp. bulgaricus]|nr:hypothetical protein [Lactobacillus delbrueckii subsp. bulgaricus]MBT8816307.1 hypothetical protein [Lactobacillus delbrueckii subsp. bulgaricus]MBT8841643.1 hypothetical protein [Lactobacillus delbrueckii subsp. bulgaricus]MBT8862140.1 hypothetical protein [Lactobacillus delbrueckii subsp. bulgaricus]MBT8863714.1 hypothetical protein [Lactobacillus delbrueckii subsp. bulgaricus]